VGRNPHLLFEEEGMRKKKRPWQKGQVRNPFGYNQYSYRSTGYASWHSTSTTSEVPRTVCGREEPPDQLLKDSLEVSSKKLDEISTLASNVVGLAHGKNCQSTTKTIIGRITRWRIWRLFVGHVTT
jgi:hypothetical protein